MPGQIVNETLRYRIWDNEFCLASSPHTAQQGLSHRSFLGTCFVALPDISTDNAERTKVEGVALREKE